MSATSFLESSVTKHGIYTGRLAAGYNNDYAPIFNEMARDTRRLLAGDLTSFERVRLTRVLSQLNTIIDGQLDLYDAQALEDMTEFANYEAGFATKMVQGVMTVELAATSQERIAHILSQTEMRLVSGKKIQQFTIEGMLSNFRQAVKDKAASDIRQTIANGVAQGLSADRISRNVANGVSSSMSKGVIRQWSETNVRTAVAHVSQEAMNEAVRANADLIQWEKFSATLDSRTSLQCIHEDSRRYRVGEGAYPPLHFKCVLPDTSVLPVGRVDYISKRPFNGEVVRIRVSGDTDLTVTPNHPILTNTGFVPAKFINEGDTLVSRVSTDTLMPSSDDDQMVSGIENGFNASLASSKMLAAPVPMTAKDFHNDVTEGEIAIIAVDRELSDSIVSSISHQIVKHFFEVTRVSGSVFESGLSLFANCFLGLYASSRGDVSISGESLDLLGRRIIHSCLLLLRPVSGLDTEVVVRLSDGIVTNIKSGSDTVEADTTLMELLDSFKIESSPLLRSYLESELLSDSTDSSLAALEFSSDFAKYETLIEETLDVIGVDKFTFTGHVYNLGCSESAYSANGIITHNCRSRRLPYIPDEYAIIKKSERASVFGPVDSRTTYSSFLKRQSVEFQEDVLGVERAKLFREGKVSLDGFVDDQGRTLTLKQLQAREGITIGETRTKVVKPTQKQFIKDTKPVKTFKTRKPEPVVVEIPDTSTALSKAAPPKRVQLSSQEVGEIEYYKGDGFYQNNRVLRDKASHSKSDIAEAEARQSALNKIIDKSETSKDHSFYRGIRSNALFENAESLVGKKLKNPTVQSTSFDESIAKNYAGLIGGFSAERNASVVMKINAKKGSKALNISEYTSINASEREILLKGNSTYTVKSVRNVLDDNGNIAYKEIEVDYDS